MHTHDRGLIPVHIRWMVRRDTPGVLAIERASFAQPWTEEDFLIVLRQRNCIGMVAERGDDIVGFTCYELHRNRIDILNFAVAPTCRRMGVGALLVTRLIGKLSSHRRTRLTVSVRESNLPAQLFFWSQGLRATGVTRHYYRDVDESAYHFTYQTPEGVDDPPNEVPPNRIAQYGEG